MPLKVLPKFELAKQRAKQRARIAANLAVVEDFIALYEKDRSEQEARREKRPPFLRGILNFLEMMTPVETVHLGLFYYSRRDELRRELEEFDRT